MSKYPISREGVRRLLELAQGIKATNTKMETDGNVFLNAVLTEGDKLGEYQLKILKAVKKVIEAQREGNEAILEVSKNVEEVAVKIKIICDKNGLQ